MTGLLSSVTVSNSLVIKNKSNGGYQETAKTVVLVPYFISNALYAKNFTVDKCLDYSILSKLVNESDIVMFNAFNKIDSLSKILSIDINYTPYSEAFNNQVKEVFNLFDYGTTDKEFVLNRLQANHSDASLETIFSRFNNDISFDVQYENIKTKFKLDDDKTDKDNIVGFTKSYMYNTLNTDKYLFVIIGKYFFTEKARNIINVDESLRKISFIETVLKAFSYLRYDNMAKYWMFYLFVNLLMERRIKNHP